MRLVDVYTTDVAVHVLYEILRERPQYAWISHDTLPSWSEHTAFVAIRPFLHWYLIAIPVIDAETHGVGGAAYVGAIEANDRNELGVAILKRYQGRGYGTAALRRFIDTHKPLPAIKAIRNGRWLANIGVDNLPAKEFFAKAGFHRIQETWAL